jgi:hypothetical protein
MMVHDYTGIGCIKKDNPTHMLGLFKLKFMNFKFDFDWQFLFDSYLVIFFYCNVQNVSLGNQKPDFCCYTLERLGKEIGIILFNYVDV